MNETADFKILDCSLRDGGYYTNWDFSSSFVHTYLECLNSLPVDYIEIGYRSKPKAGYLGAYFYCPEYIMQQLKEISQKKLVIILNEKDVGPNNLEELLKPCKGIISMVRIAVAPERLSRVSPIAVIIKEMGFELSVNIMYLSQWNKETVFLQEIKGIGEIADFIYLVDSYGGMYPKAVGNWVSSVASSVPCQIGFHAHNNMELALANSLSAAEAGAGIIDATIVGMGRGAGNLKTELLLTSLESQGKVQVDYDRLSQVVDQFSELQKQYQWGPNLAYMVSGANSLPQQEVMAQLNKRFYTLGSIVRGVSNRSKGKRDNLHLREFEPTENFETVVIVGGGPSGSMVAEAVGKLLISRPSSCIIHSSSRNAAAFKEIENHQFHCLEGNEGQRLESVYKNLKGSSKTAVLPPFPRSMGTYIPKELEDNAYQLKSISFSDRFTESATALAIETALKLKAQHLFFVGYDGYEGHVTNSEMELFMENDFLFERLRELQLPVFSLTPTKYPNLRQQSIYTLL